MKPHRLFTMALMLMVGLSSSFGKSVTFKTTTITDGEFAPSTTWYTLQIGASGLYIAADEGTQYIPLNRTASTFADEDLWCFVGDNDAGYRIYNKNKGTGYVLAAPSAITSSNDGTAYPILKSATKLGTYKDLWQFEPTSQLGNNTPAYWMYQHGIAANKVNNRSGKFAFWLSGADAGSAVQVLPIATDIVVDLSTGHFTKSNAAGTFSSEWAHDGDIALTLSCGVNNMAKSGSNIKIYSGASKASTYTFAVQTGWQITGYTFKFNAAEQAAVGVSLKTCDNQQFRVTTSTQSVSVTNLNGEANASFTIQGNNNGILLKNITVNVKRTLEIPEPQVEVFTTTGIPNYRIPAIATTRNGKIIAVADYRYGGSDIGYGSVELRRRVSGDNGRTWSAIAEFTHGNYAASPKPKYDAAYGDPCIVADRTSNRQMILSCSGNTPFPDGSRSVHQGITRFYSIDDGMTWSNPVNLESQFYGAFDNDCNRGPIRSMFIGSGKICQSSIVKVKDYYRLYCAGLVKDKNGTNCNYVFYSDDFGGTWNVLGDKNTPPIPTGADEPKAEELPDGSVVCSSRTSGRWFNIYTFTNTTTAEGSWGTVAKSDNSNRGTYGASCNGEIMVVPATRLADGEAVYVALQSVPAASSRINVSIYYKGLENLADFATPATFAADWEGCHQASKMGSAYSTMIMMPNNHVGFLYEESTHGADYTIVFKDYSLEQITDSTYAYNPTLDRAGWVANHVQAMVDDCFSDATNSVGSVDTTQKASVDAAVAKYRNTHLQSDYDAIRQALEKARIQPQANVRYVLRNKLYPTLYITHDGIRFTGAVRNESNATQEFKLEDAGDGLWKIFNAAKNLYFGDSPAVYAEIPTTSIAASAGLYRCQSSAAGVSALVSQNPTNGSYPAIHMDASKKLVPWETGADGSLWYIIPIEKVDALDDVCSSINTRSGLYDLSGRSLADKTSLSSLTRGIYIRNHKKVFVR